METLETLYKSWSNLSPHSRINMDGLLFDRYKVETILGIGGTSLVLSAHDLNLGRLVAVKVWNPHTGTFDCWGTDRKFYKREADYFRREAQLLASLKHRYSLRDF